MEDRTVQFAQGEFFVVPMMQPIERAMFCTQNVFPWPGPRCAWVEMKALRHLRQARARLGFGWDRPVLDPTAQEKVPGAKRSSDL